VPRGVVRLEVDAELLVEDQRLVCPGDGLLRVRLRLRLRLRVRVS